MGGLLTGTGVVAGRVCVAMLLMSVLAACGGQDSAHHNAETQYDEELAAQIVADDIVYLTQLGLMRGHLYVGVALYELGERVEAATHMKHPESELYAELVPGLRHRGAVEFADALQALAVAVETRQADTEVDRLYRALERDIALAEEAVGELTASRIAAVMTSMLEPVAEEYELAVNEQGRMTNAHEYQDALGFVHVIRAYAGMLAGMSDDVNRLQGLNTQLAFLEATFQGPVPARNASLTSPAAVRQIVEQLKRTLSGF